MNTRPTLKRPPARGMLRLQHDPLIENSAYILLSSATMGALGFLFWFACAHLYTTNQVGLASVVISATSLIAYLSLLGLNATLVRRLPKSADSSAFTTSALAAVTVASAVLSLAYVLVTPVIAPRLTFLHDSTLYACAFVVLSAATAGNLLTDSIFIAYRAAKYNLLIDGVIQGTSKLALPFVLTAVGAFGIYAATGVASLVALACSCGFLIYSFGYRPRLPLHFNALQGAFRYSSANYVSSILNLIPIFVLPIVVLDRRGASEAAYYFVAFQVANLVYAASYAIAQSLFAEGSYELDVAALARRSAKLTALAAIAGTLCLCAIGPFLLALFGSSYQSHAATTLIVFGAAVPFVSLNAWASALLRITEQLKPMIWSNVAYAFVICTLAAACAAHSLVAVAGAWLLGNAISGAIAVAALYSSHQMRTVRTDATAGPDGGMTAHRIDTVIDHNGKRR